MFTHRFWRRLIILASGLLLASFVCVGFLMSNSASARAMTRAMSKAGTKQCSNATLTGKYVWAEEGYQIVGSDRVPFAIAGVETYDGNGHDMGVISQSTNGKITHFVHFTSSYTVKPDCTVTETQTDETGAVTHYDEFVTPNGNLLSFVQTDAGTVVSGVLSRGTATRVSN